MKRNHEFVHPVKSAFRYELWSERFRYPTESSSEDSTQDAKDTTTVKTHFSKASILDMNKQLFLAAAKSEKLDIDLYNESKNNYITEESIDGPIEFFTTKVAETKKGFLLKPRPECGDFIKRFYFLKNNLLYYYG